MYGAGSRRGTEPKPEHADPVADIPERPRVRRHAGVAPRAAEGLRWRRGSKTARTWKPTVYAAGAWRTSATRCWRISTFVSAWNRSAACCALSAFRMFRRVPFHPWAAAAKQTAFRRDFRRLALDAAPEGTDPEGIEICFQDEARAGQKGMLSRVWTRKGSRPRVVRDHR